MYKVNDQSIKSFLRSRSKLSRLLIHWGGQGFFNMDNGERNFKIALELSGISILGWMFRNFFSTRIAILLAIITTHSLNFLFNAHPWVVLKHFGIGYYDENGLMAYTADIAKRAEQCPAILGAGVWGGFARKSQSETSDVDIRLIRRAGFFNTIQGSWFLLTERSRANWYRFPLDAYLLDEMSSLSRLNSTEIPLLLCDNEGVLQKRYPTAIFLASIGDQ